jgi:hypothetical protein
MSNYLGFEPTGSSSYYFVSYNNEDAERVSGLARAMNDAGIPLWYDYGIEYGEQWTWQINEKIAGAKAMILFLTKGILQKDNSYVQKEYKIAAQAGTKIIVLLVDAVAQQDIPVRKLDWWVDIRDKQCLEIYKLDSREKALAEIRRALNLPEQAETGPEPDQESAAAGWKKPEKPGKPGGKKWLLPVILLCVIALGVAVWQVCFPGRQTEVPYDLPDVMEYLKGHFRALETGEQGENKYYSLHTYYDYADWEDAEADVSGLLKTLESGEWPFRLADTQEYDYLSSSNSYYWRYSYLYTGKKEVSPILFRKTEDRVKTHLQILIGRLHGEHRTLVEVTLAPGLVYQGAERWEADSGT